MNVAIGIGTLLLGGWVLSTPDGQQQPTIAPPSLAPDIEQLPPAGSAGHPSARPTSPYNRRSSPSDESRGGGSGRAGGQQPMGNQSQGMGMMPMAPTDYAQEGSSGLLGMPQPPTAGPDAGNLAAPSSQRDMFMGPMGPTLPNLPMSRRANAPRTAALGADDLVQRTQGAAPSAYAGRMAPEKPFSTMRPFSSGVSPWMNLFRNDTGGGSIDNYTTLVRPALDQRSMNQQFSMDIYGLERENRIQRATMQRMQGDNTRALQGVVTPQYYKYSGGGGGGYGPYNYGSSGYGRYSNYGQY
jgi:hypothetical protein